MKCPNCSAECSDQALECDFCGHPFIEGAQATPAAPPPSDNLGRATYTVSEPTYSHPPMPEPSQSPPPMPSENPYAANYPSSSKKADSYRAGSVPNHLIWAILATLFCCLPTGIVAIVYAAQVGGKLAAGDYEGAVSSSNTAKMWSWISFGSIAVIFVLYLLMVLMVGVGGMASPNS